MKKQVLLSISQIHLRSRMKQTVIASLGVTFGISMFIAMIGFMTGVNQYLEDLMLDNTPHIHIYNDIEPSKHQILDRVYPPSRYMTSVSGIKPKEVKQNLKDGMQLVKILTKDPHVEGVSPQLVAQVFYNYGAITLNGNVTGVDMPEYHKLFKFGDKIIEGSIEKLSLINNGVIIGKGLAKKLNIGVDDRINITTNEGTQMSLVVVGIFSMGIAQNDNTQSFSTLKTAQRILNKNNDYITDINIRLTNIDDSKRLAKSYGDQFGYKSDDWTKTNEEILVSFTLRNAITVAVSLSLLIVAGFGIYNILTMMIYEKMKDIAILKATGFTGKDVLKIFLTEAVIIGVIGGMAGLLLGFLLSVGISHIPFHSEQVITLDHMPMSFNVYHYLFGLVFALATTSLAGLLPARRASSIDPVEIIRGK